MLKAGDLARREDHRVRGGQKRENLTRSGDTRDGSDQRPK